MICRSSYQDLGGLYGFYEGLVAFDTRTSISTIGTTYEGREIKMFRIMGNPDGLNIFLEAGAVFSQVVLKSYRHKQLFLLGIHAREWISPAVLTYIVDQLLYGPDSQYYLDNLSFYIIPSLNPDGYQYSWDSVS